MKKPFFLFLFFLLFMAMPMTLAWNQNVPVRFAYQNVVLFLSLGAFGVLLGQFWLTRLLPRNLAEMKLYRILRWHKVIGYTAGVIMLLHPILIIGRRFRVEESDPIGNLLLVLQSPAMLPAIIAWALLALTVLLALVRRRFPARTWRTLHGLLSSAFAGFAAWHVVTTGRHSDALLSAFWLVLAAGAVAAWLCSYLPAHSKAAAVIDKGVAHEAAQ